jgi:hypothetical protein
MSSVRCPECKQPVALPADYALPTIHCSICWADVPLSHVRAEFAPEAVPAGDDALFAGPANPFAAIPGKAAKGLEPFEDVLKSLVTIVPQYFVAPAPRAAIALAEPPPAPKAKPGKALGDPDRQPRGRRYVEPEHPEDEPFTVRSGPPAWLLYGAIALVVFVLGFVLFRIL